ncbi:FAD-dependent oxidoreductase [Salinisphaera sp.]|uniref:FAD-dependent oxidoreductase n=1 Tax=Salinisphaera sp. TaxID=1914330 RepID=UPI002D7A1179|nr:FAD-dependent oxidoreductase [Salinisphaera sp.]HET7313792.1 FAD-dependent oxidoreductase [Salinisphaera sp.]
MKSTASPPLSTVTEADAIVIGGGIYGLMIALEAGKTGRRVLVVERDAVGGATSANWFRILHGGLRYLQTLDIPRVRESVAERRWFQRFAPDLVRPMRFLMPLYGDGSRRPTAFRAAFLADAALSARRNAGLGAGQTLPRGRVLNRAETQALYPGVRPEGLRGGALWHDVIAGDGAQLIARLRAEAEAYGARVLEGVEARDLVVERGAAAGVIVKRAGMAPGTVRAPVVINAAGPWSAGLAECFGGPAPELFRPALAFNLLLAKTPLSDVGLAVSPPDTTNPTLFVYPHEGRIFAGTWHASWRQESGRAEPPEAEIDAFLAALNAALPALGARRQDVLKIFAGLLPARRADSAEPADRAIIRDHRETGGPAGLFSVSGVKFTTARRVAEKLVRRLPARKPV